VRRYVGPEAAIPTYLSLSATEMPNDQLRELLAEYLELEQSQIFRELLVVRCGRMAAVALVLALTTHVLSTAAWVITIGLILALPLGAWMTELRWQWRLAKRLNACKRVHATAQPHEKVVKSS